MSQEVLAPVLKLVSSGIRVAGADRFVACEHFIDSRKYGLELWDCFQNNFLGKVEENVDEATLAVHDLLTGSVDALLREELGQVREEISLVHFFNLLQKQLRGEEGALRVDEYHHIAYVRNVNQILCAVYARWIRKKRVWYIFSSTTPSMVTGWIAGCQVICRDC